MARIRLTQRRVDALAPRRTVNDVRDTQLKGYGVRVMPSGAKRYFIHSQHRGRRVWKTVADAETVTETEARARARSMLTALRDGGEPDAEDPGEVLSSSSPRKSSPDTAAAGNRELSGRIASTFAGRFSPSSGDVPSGR